MLPASLSFQTLRRGATAATLALSLAIPAPAIALDKHEQGILAGALGVLLIQGLVKSQNYGAAPAPLPQHTPVRNVVSVNRTPAAYAFASYSRSERRAIQRSLARAGYYYGPLDGAFGAGTYRATLGYARDIRATAALNSQAGAYGVYDRLLYASY